MTSATPNAVKAPRSSGTTCVEELRDL